MFQYLNKMTTKRKYKSSKKKKVVKKKKIELENAPPVNNIKDLIEIGNTFKIYKNIDSLMLWNILPHLNELDNMIGMKKLKNTVFNQVIYYLQNFHTLNRNEEYLHTVISGAPGTGKTTVAHIIGNLYKSLGILSKNGKFRIAHRDDFIAGYLGQTAIKTNKLLNSCLGGVLFIDEAYSLGPGQQDKDSFSKEALDTLTSFLSEHKNDFCCIIAGYESDIEKCFFKVNKGLKRRFQWNHKIDDYDTEELTDIFMKKVKDIKWQLSIEKKQIQKIIKNNKDLFKFGGGDVENLISKCKISHAKRVFSLDSIHKFILSEKDIKNAIKLINQNNKKEKKNTPPYGMYT